MAVFDRLPPKKKLKEGLLIGALLSLFLVLPFQNLNVGFEKGHHGFLSSHGAAIAKNVGWRHHFLMFHAATMAHDGSIHYQAYNRFPITAFILIKAVMMIDPGDLSMEIHLARQLMNLFFIASVLICFLIAYELSQSRWAAVCIAFLTFASAYMNYYNDMIFNDVPTLFGFMLTAHGIVLQEMHSRKRQAIIKSLIGISLGWQVVAMVVAYGAVTVIDRFTRERSLKALYTLPSVRMGIAVFLLGGALLGMNLVLESRASDKPFFELSTLKSIAYRLGQDEQFNENYADQLAWPHFTKEQLRRIGAVSLPYMLKKHGNFTLAGALILSVSLLSAGFSRHRLMLLTLVISGIVWAFPMRNFTMAHDFQSIFYIGIPFVFYFQLVVYVQRHAEVLLPVVAVFSMVCFFYANITFNSSKNKWAHQLNPITWDFQRIIDITEEGNTFYVDGDARTIAGGYHAVDYYLAGNYFSSLPDAEYIISKNRGFSPDLLTPRNTNVYLFRGTPRSARAFCARGKYFAQKGDFEKAMDDFSTALEKEPDYVPALAARGETAKRLGRYGRAVQDFRLALEKSPDNIKALNGLSWLLSTCPNGDYRNGSDALTLALRLVEIDGNPIYQDTLAAAYAETGDFDSATSVQEEVVRLLRDKASVAILASVKNHLTAYKQRRPWRDPAVETAPPR